MRQKLAIFDVDGTLVDSRAMISAAMQMAFTDQGFEAPDYNVTRKIVGLSLMEAIDKIAPPEATHADITALTGGYKNAFVTLRESGAQSAPLYEGARELLGWLKSEGWLLGIATGKSRRGVEAMLSKNGLEGLFGASYCADDGPGKPDPFMVEANLKALGIEPRGAVMVGDTSFDMLMGKAANVTSYGVSWGFHTKGEIQSGGADVIVDTMVDLQKALDGFAAVDEYLSYGF